jgi:hypothetical protein
MPGHTLINAIAPLSPLYQQTEGGIDPTCRRNAAAIYARRNEIPPAFHSHPASTNNARSW